MNMENYRIERDSMGEVKVPANALYGAQTQRSLNNFKIGDNLMPREIINSLIIVKRACAMANRQLLPDKMTEEKLNGILCACDYLSDNKCYANFPLSVWQTGSGTQTNMNLNEVIANLSNSYIGKKLIHPNDDVNMSQSSNDTFPSAMNIAAYMLTCECLLPACDSLICSLKELEERYEGIKKVGRTHFQDATPIYFSQQISGWRALVENGKEQVLSAIPYFTKLAIGGTAVGTGINAPCGFDSTVCKIISEYTGYEFIPDTNKFHALSSKDAFTFSHGAIRSLACNLFKIANDIRMLSSGPRCGLGEIIIPANEPGSSIMPGKVNPTQCEALSMVCAQIMGNDTTIGFCASQGNFELNVYMPVIIFNYVFSVNILSDAISSFDNNCVKGIVPNKEKMRENLEKSLMNVTYLNTYIGYDSCAEVAKLAYKENITLKEAVLRLGLMSENEFDKIFDKIIGR